MSSLSWYLHSSFQKVPWALWSALVSHVGRSSRQSQQTGVSHSPTSLAWESPSSSLGSTFHDFPYSFVFSSVRQICLTHSSEQTFAESLLCPRHCASLAKDTAVNKKKLLPPWSSREEGVETNKYITESTHVCVLEEKPSLPSSSKALSALYREAPVGRE